MIKVRYNEELTNLKITGHANYAEYGEDIVCSSVSSIIVTSINIAHEFNKSVKYSDDGNTVIIENNTSDKNVHLVLKNMIEMLKDLERQYPKNINVSKGE
ncbi:MAG: ribosomal-processing cysteine protease Prp [Bacilli bacterium]|nr:ribosomal-processing cysteine protease Prp [Bacilli bacterium]